MVGDRFTSYHKLAAVYERGKDFSISTRAGDTWPGILIMAPHGGKIEMRTAEIADATAGSDYSCYIFEAKLPANNRREMHIASETYDVPEAEEAVKTATLVVALHGRKDEKVDEGKIWMGGLDRISGRHIGDTLAEAGFPVRYDPPKFKGTHGNNICNRGTNKGGIQLEIPLSLRQDFQDSSTREEAFIAALRKALETLR